MQKTTKQYDNIDELCADILNYKHIEINIEDFILVLTISDVLKKSNEIELVGHGLFIKYDPEKAVIVTKKVKPQNNLLGYYNTDIIKYANSDKLRFVKASKVAKMYSLYRQIEQKINPLFDYALEI